MAYERGWKRRDVLLGAGTGSLLALWPERARAGYLFEQLLETEAALIQLVDDTDLLIPSEAMPPGCDPDIVGSCEELLSTGTQHEFRSSVSLMDQWVTRVLCASALSDQELLDRVNMAQDFPELDQYLSDEGLSARAILCDEVQAPALSPIAGVGLTLCLAGAGAWLLRLHEVRAARAAAVAGGALAAGLVPRRAAAQSTHDALTDILEVIFILGVLGPAVPLARCRARIVAIILLELIPFDDAKDVLNTLKQALTGSPPIGLVNAVITLRGDVQTVLDLLVKFKIKKLKTLLPTIIRSVNNVFIRLVKAVPTRAGKKIVIRVARAILKRLAFPLLLAYIAIAMVGEWPNIKKDCLGV